MNGRHPTPAASSSQRRIYTISDITSDIKRLLEDTFPLIWVTGEISNFRRPASGHYYFALKDSKAQINAVIFRNQSRNLGFDPEDGMQITGLGRVSVYEPRGTYQLILEYLEPRGIGAIQIAFEKLKASLSEEGLFDEKWKKPLPYLPRKIGIITSPTGAVIHDILTVLDARFPNLRIAVFPVKVQGKDAADEIKAAIEAMDTVDDIEVAILARGGGSLEDLAPFNAETVARAVFGAGIPIVSAVGHETDYTISDFVADLRAPTPSAAAEMIMPSKSDLKQKVGNTERHLVSVFRHRLEQIKSSLADISGRIADPKRRIDDLRIRWDDIYGRLLMSAQNGIGRKKERLDWRIDRLRSYKLLQVVAHHKDNLYRKGRHLKLLSENALSKHRSDLREMAGKLVELDPNAILSRGYSITRALPDWTIVRNAEAVSLDQKLNVMVAEGDLEVSVTTVNPSRSASTGGSESEGEGH